MLWARECPCQENHLDHLEFNAMRPPLISVSLCSSVTLNQILHEFWEKTYLGLMKNLYWMRTVMRKNTTPSTAMAKRFRPTKSQDSGETKRFSPGRHNAEIQLEWRHQRKTLGPSSNSGSNSPLFLGTPMIIAYDKGENYRSDYFPCLTFF